LKEGSDRGRGLVAPGAKISTTDSWLEKDARASAIVKAPTVLVLRARAGKVELVSVLEFPAAT